MSTASEFLRHINPEGPWNLSTIHPDTGAVESVVARSPEYMERWIEERNGKANIYWTPNPTPTPSGWRGRAANKDYEMVRILVVDVDSNYKGGPSNEEVLRRFREFGFSHAVLSGGGVQGYIELSAPVDKQAAQEMNQWLIEEFGGDKGTYTVERLVRVPGTWNLPNEKKRNAGRTKVMAEVAFSTDTLKEDWELERRPIPKRKGDGGESIDINLEYDLDLYEVPESVLYTIKHGQDERDSKQGDRSRYVYGVVCDLIRAGVPDDVIGGVLLDPGNGISESLYEKGDQEAWRQMHRAIWRAHDEEDVKLLDPQASAHEDFDGLDATLSNMEQSAAKERSKEEKALLEHAERYRPQQVADLLKKPRPKWLVKKWMLQGSLNAIVGGEKTFKTFTAIDLGCRIALGMDWHGVDTVQGNVLYIIAEGNEREFADRVLAWCMVNEHDPEDLWDKFTIIPVRVGLDNHTDMDAFNLAMKMYGVNEQSLVFVDTLAQNMDGAENDTRDMNLFVRGANEIRFRYRCAVFIVHHTGKDPAKIYRGNSALVGAVDSMWYTIREDDESTDLVLQLYRSRFAQQGIKRVFKAIPVVTQEATEEEDEAETLVMTFVREGTKEDGRQRIVTPTALWHKALVFMAERPGCAVVNQAVVGEGLGIKNSGSTSKLFKTLKDKHLITGTGPFVLTQDAVMMAVEMGAQIPQNDET